MRQDPETPTFQWSEFSGYLHSDPSNLIDSPYIRSEPRIKVPYRCLLRMREFRTSESDISQALWPAHLKPQEDELLSSWLVRLAMAHGLKLHTFCSVVWPGKQIWNRDIDKCVDRTVLDLLSRKTAVSKTVATNTSLAAYQGRLYEHHNPYGNTFWIMPLGIFHRTHKRFGLQFCPQCLAEDKQPYYRRRWRMAFITCCETHSLTLLDRCCQCDAAINFHRDEMGDRKRYSPNSMVFCHLCKFDLRESASYASLAISDGRVRAFQIRLTQTLDQGWMEITTRGPINSHLYFAVLHQLMKVLAMSKRANILRSAISRDYQIENPTLRLTKELRGIEQLNVNARQTLVSMARCLLEDWPERFIKICHDNKIWSATLLKDFASPPFWFWSVIHDHLFRTSYCPSDLEINSIVAYISNAGKPLSRKSVSRYLGVNDAFRKRKTQTNLDLAGLPASPR